jgi:hypothetical protein
VYLRPLALAASTYVPGLAQLLARKGTGGTDSAPYCYDVWMKHLVLLSAAGMHGIPRTLAELGPGDSLGVGLAAILCGVERYYALDVVRHSNPNANLAIFDELVALFERRAPRAKKGWPDYDSLLDARLFPGQILTDQLLERTLAPERVRRIREQLAGPRRDARAGQGVVIDYRVPWNDRTVLEPASVDVVLSHVVLQSVTDLEATYGALYAWLKPGGYMSHQIDFTSFRTARRWNGHWTYSDRYWKIVVGRRPYLINREPHSTHVRLMQEQGFELIRDLQNRRGAEEGIPRSELDSRWKDMGEDDLACSGAFIQARKPL